MKDKKVYYHDLPSKVKVGGQILDVISVYDENVIPNSEEATGYVNLSAGIMKLDGNCSSSVQRNTFYHELVHAILDTMGEYNLSRNEKFVCCFSSFLNEAMENAIFIEEKED